ncbi:putative ubiquitin conjugation factor E4 [Platanthera zijinensis]|uniref:Ubiquitin conjugation factor E4 n=1 Tax=Platanthera zijinensis TaxID=2320716 RepID=A0AAP0G7S9_9ASPA
MICLIALFLKDRSLLQQALSFNRLAIIWLVSLVGGFKIPLPVACPMEFACMPEHFIEDAMDLLILTSRIPRALDGFLLVGIAKYVDAMLDFISNCVEDPYLIGKGNGANIIGSDLSLEAEDCSSMFVF